MININSIISRHTNIYSGINAAVNIYSEYFSLYMGTTFT